MSGIDKSLPLRQALLSYLKADATIASIVGARIYPEQAPATPAWPFIRYGFPFVQPFEASCWSGSEEDLTIHAFAKGPGSDACSILAKAIVELLNKAENEEEAEEEFQEETLLLEGDLAGGHLLLEGDQLGGSFLIEGDALVLTFNLPSFWTNGRLILEGDLEGGNLFFEGDQLGGALLIEGDALLFSLVSLDWIDTQIVRDTDEAAAFHAVIRFNCKAYETVSV